MFIVRLKIYYNIDIYIYISFILEEFPKMKKLKKRMNKIKNKKVDIQT
jgi:hypothetical protein